MPLSDAYSTAATYRALLSKSDTAEDPEILDDLTAVSRFLDYRLGRFFTKDAAVVARVYLPEIATLKLYVDDIASKTGLLVKVDEDLDGLFTDETAWAATDYRLLPLNADKEPEAKPWTAIEITPWGTKTRFARRYPVEVTATFGWPAVPKAIERATVHLTGILRLETPRATSRIPEGIEAAISASPEAQRILRELAGQYARPRVFV